MTSDSYFDPKDHRCPHDAWLESFSLTARSSDQQEDVRTLSLRVWVLGAYHDGHIELLYPRILTYRMTMERGEGGDRD